MPDAPAPTSEPEEARERRDLLVAKVGARLIGVFADEAASVTDWREVTPLPGAPLAVLGIACVRGRMLTVLDALALLGERKAEEIFSPRFLIALRGDEQLALAVDSAEHILEIYLDEIDAEQEEIGLVQCVIRRESETISLFNVQEIFNAAMHGAERRRQRT